MLATTATVVLTLVVFAIAAGLWFRGYIFMLCEYEEPKTLEFPERRRV